MRHPNSMRNASTWLGIALASLAVAPVASAGTAEYEIVFEGLWNRSHASASFPRSAHFTTLIGDTHAPGEPLWREGELASRGVERVAEDGVTSQLGREIDDRIAAGISGGEIRVGSLFSLPRETTAVFPVDEDFPEISLVSMVAPSPDWFVGVSGLSLRDEAGWIPALSVDLLPYDAGTESGNRFRLGNSPSNPHEPIRHRGDPFFDEAVVARLHFTLLPEPGPAASALAALAGLGCCGSLRRIRRANPAVTSS